MCPAKELHISEGVFFNHLCSYFILMLQCIARNSAGMIFYTWLQSLWMHGKLSICKINSPEGFLKKWELLFIFFDLPAVSSVNSLSSLLL